MTSEIENYVDLVLTYLLLLTKKLMSKEIDLANKTLDEDITIQMHKDCEHHRLKYKIT